MVMRIKYTYQDPAGRGRVHDFWRNFVDDIHRYQQLPDPVWKLIHLRLREYGAVIDEENLEFDSEEAAMMFLLRWS
jgi:hypothetical protein